MRRLLERKPDLYLRELQTEQKAATGGRLHGEARGSVFPVFPEPPEDESPRADRSSAFSDSLDQILAASST